MDALARAATILNEADAVLIAAGAGMSVPSGIDYNDTKSFATRCPGMVAHGFSHPYQLIGHPVFHDNPRLKWGYGGIHAKWMTTHGRGDVTYANLKKLVGARPYFVLTSNADGMFERNAYDKARIYTPQGSYSLLQCMSPTCKHVWSSDLLIQQLNAPGAVDLATMEVVDSVLLPKCPNCASADVYFNLNGGSW